MKTMLKVDHASISYKIGDFKDIGLKEWTMRHLKHNYHVETFLAVNDVSFELMEGDMLGIIGSNGAGKSTLLKAVTGVMEPRSGSIERFGTVSALLELASGFDGDLTVKENAYLRGAMLGYTREFMDGTYQQILDFSGLREFEDRPFKQLSTGMQSRLAFSVASLVQPEILILDEVLSVGDGAFQEKSAAKMREIIDGGAATILVSHSLAQVRELCNKVLWLDKGEQIDYGEAKQICDTYQAFLNEGAQDAKKYSGWITAQLPENPVGPEVDDAGAAFTEQEQISEAAVREEETAKVICEDAVNCYRYILGREPENTDVVSYDPNDLPSRDELRRAFLESEEFRSQLAALGLGTATSMQRMVNYSYQEILEDDDFLMALRNKLIQGTSVWGDPSRISIEQPSSMVNTLFNTVSGTISIGAYSFTGHNVSILTGMHYIEQKEYARMTGYPTEGRDISIGRGVWLASNVTVLGPCTIGDNAVVMAGSVVVPGTQIPPNTVWAGMPAKQVRAI